MREMKTRGTPLSEQQEAVLRLVEEEKLIYVQVCARLGISMSDLRTLYWTAKRMRADFARHGTNGLWFLPGRPRYAIEWIGLTTRTKAKAAIASGRLVWDEKQKKVIYKGTRVRNLGWKSWRILQEWVSDDWTRVRKDTGQPNRKTEAERGETRFSAT
jgi:hypothetical protein